MNKIVEFLNDTKIFYLATIDGDKPRVRPFGAVMEKDGKIYFCTNNQKDVYRQMQKNPNIEISATKENGDWLRLSGKAVFDSSKDTKQTMLDECPVLKTMYSADDGKFEIFYITNASATVFSLCGKKETLEI
ncbi:MAG TPA: pyridoxamine 5'-phosphate oxidase family protein [Candidatus Adamsella sp.]|nr:pyridoxamine 5'-phosphate oxidase family protein [Candidatus Adamsella sp.]